MAAAATKEMAVRSGSGGDDGDGDRGRSRSPQRLSALELVQELA